MRTCKPLLFCIPEVSHAGITHFHARNLSVSRQRISAENSHLYMDTKSISSSPASEFCTGSWRVITECVTSNNPLRSNGQCPSRCGERRTGIRQHLDTSHRMCSRGLATFPFAFRTVFDLDVLFAAIASSGACVIASHDTSNGQLDRCRSVFFPGFSSQYLFHHEHYRVPQILYRMEQCALAFAAESVRAESIICK